MLALDRTVAWPAVMQSCLSCTGSQSLQVLTCLSVLQLPGQALRDSLSDFAIPCRMAKAVAMASRCRSMATADVPSLVRPGHAFRSVALAARLSKPAAACCTV